MNNEEEQYKGDIDEWLFDDVVRLWDNRCKMPAITRHGIFRPDVKEANGCYIRYLRSELKYLHAERWTDYFDSDNKQIGQGDILARTYIGFGGNILKHRWELRYGEYVNEVYDAYGEEALYNSFGWHLHDIKGDYDEPFGSIDPDKEINGYFTIVGHKDYCDEISS